MKHKLSLAEGDTINVGLDGYAGTLTLSWDHILEAFLQGELHKLHEKRYQQPQSEDASKIQPVNISTTLGQPRGFNP